MKPTLALAVVALCLSLPACANHDDMMDSADTSPRMTTAMAATRDESATHHAAVARAASLDEVRAESGRHANAMGTRMAEMRAGMGAMSACRMMDSGMMGRMSDTLGQMSSEVGHHDELLRVADDLVAARAACDAHMGKVGSMMDRMEGSVRTMCAP